MLASMTSSDKKRTSINNLRVNNKTIKTPKPRVMQEKNIEKGG